MLYRFGGSHPYFRENPNDLPVYYILLLLHSLKQSDDKTTVHHAGTNTPHYLRLENSTAKIQNQQRGFRTHFALLLYCCCCTEMRETTPGVQPTPRWSLHVHRSVSNVSASFYRMKTTHLTSIAAARVFYRSLFGEDISI